MLGNKYFSGKPHDSNQLSYWCQLNELNKLFFNSLLKHKRTNKLWGIIELTFGKECEHRGISLALGPLLSYGHFWSRQGNWEPELTFCVLSRLKIIVWVLSSLGNHFPLWIGSEETHLGVRVTGSIPILTLAAAQFLIVWVAQKC